MINIVIPSTLISFLFLSLFSPLNSLGYFGMVLCFILSALGTAQGILLISQYVSGASIKSPQIGTKSVLGTVVCEANFLTGIITCVMLSHNITLSLSPKVHYVYFSSGLFVGLCNYYSSITVGKLCGVISLMDARDPSLFFKIVVLEVIPASIGLIGFILGIVMNSKVHSFALE